MERLFYLNTLYACFIATFTQSNEVKLLHDIRRQGSTPFNIPEQSGGELQHPEFVGSQAPPTKGGAAQMDKERFTTSSTTQKRFIRSTPQRISFHENCDYLAHYCLKAYNTGSLCGRTLYYTYHTFKNYCLLDYVNCMERYEVWQVVYMGECYNVTVLTEYLLYPHDDDYFLDQYYVLEDH